MSGLPFLTIYDPLGESDVSIDPLGALAVYTALADALLPGLTTITSRARYLAMVCAGLHLAQQHAQLPPGPAGLTRRRKAVEGFERLWALACVMAGRRSEDANADAGLRGVRGARRAFQAFDGQARAFSPAYQLLKDQGRTGGVPTYWVTLLDAGLVDDGGVLTSEGRALATCFPAPPLSDKERGQLCSPQECGRVTLPAAALEAWARACHLGTMGPQERRLCAEALLASELRASVAAALLQMQAQRVSLDRWTMSSFRKLGRLLSASPGGRAGADVVAAILVLEEFHEAVLCVFGWALFIGSTEPARTRTSIAGEQGLQEAAQRARSCAQALAAFPHAQLETVPRRALAEFKQFAQEVRDAHGGLGVLDEVLRRHTEVQSGKVSGGSPKREWVGWTEGGRLTQPPVRYQRAAAPAVATGKIPTHPYRFEQFIGMLGQTGVFPQAAA